MLFYIMVMGNKINTDFFERKSTKDPKMGCWLWRKRGKKNAYGQVYFNGKSLLAHRVSWTVTKGEIPDGMIVCHSCDVPNCVNPEHLFLGDHKKNSDDCKSKGRAYYQNEGSDFHFTRRRRVKKLTDEQVREIAGTLYSREPLAKIAERFGVSMACISQIRRGARKTLVTGMERKRVGSVVSYLGRMNEDQWKNSPNSLE